MLGRTLYYNEPKQQVLCANVGVIELSSLLFGYLHDTTGPLAEALHTCTIRRQPLGSASSRC
jgi:hypothetical protein